MPSYYFLIHFFSEKQMRGVPRGSVELKESFNFSLMVPSSGDKW